MYSYSVGHHACHKGKNVKVFPDRSRRNICLLKDANRFFRIFKILGKSKNLCGQLERLASIFHGNVSMMLMLSLY